MGELVGGHSGVRALALFGIDGGVGEDQVLGVGDHAGVFHGAEAEGEGDGDVVALFEGEGNAEVVFQVIDDSGGDLGGVFGLVGFALGGDDAHRDVVLTGFAGVHEIEGADGDGDQIAGERTGGREDHLLHAVGLGGFGDGQSVGDGGVIFRDVNGDLPRRLEIGLIEAGEGAAGVDAFELSEEVGLLAVDAFEDAGAALLVDFALVDDVDAGWAGAEDFGGAEADEIVVAGLDGGGLRGDGGLADGEVCGVQPDQRGGFGEIDIDIDDAGEGFIAGDQGEVGSVFDGAHVVGKAQLGCFGGERGGDAESERESDVPHEIHGSVAGARLQRAHFDRSWFRRASGRASYRAVKTALVQPKPASLER